MECRILPSTLIHLDSSGSGFSSGTLVNPGTPDAFDIQATVPGRISVLMYPEQPDMVSLLTGTSGTTFSDHRFLASQLAGARDHLVQFDNVTAGEVFHLDAGVIFRSAVGPYRLYISTESTDFSTTTPHMIPLDSSGLGVQLGTIETPGDADLFAFTASVTGRAFLRVDGGANSSQQLTIDTAPGQSYGFLVSDPGAATGPYAVTIQSIADDFPDNTVFPIDLGKTSIQAGVINYPDDEDNFSFTATQSGVMTLKMQNQPGPDGRFTLQCALSVSGAPLTYDISPGRQTFIDEPPANDRIVQFEVVGGRQYTIHASGAKGSIGSYLLSLSLAVDDFSATTPYVIRLDSAGAGEQTGSIEVPGDRDLFGFTAAADGYVVVALKPEGSERVGNPVTGPLPPGTNMQGLLTFPDPGVLVPAGGGVVSLQAGWTGATRDQFAAIQVTKGDTYEFWVSADDSTIGDYTLALATYPSGATATFMTTIAAQGSPGQESVTFDFSTAPPSVFFAATAPGPIISPVSEVSDRTTTRLEAVTLPSSTTLAPPSTVTVPSGQAATAPTTPVGQSTGASNSLISTLLLVAARDNSAPSGDPAVASRQAPTAASTLLTTLLVNLVAPASTSPTATGGDDPDADPQISGTIFDDLDGDGRQAANEPGVAGETVLLEVQKGDRYVVVRTATTDARGEYAFTGVKPGDYRVRRIAGAGAGSDPTTPGSHRVKVTGDSKPRIFNFGKASKPSTSSPIPSQPSNGRATDPYHAYLNGLHDRLGNMEPREKPDGAPSLSAGVQHPNASSAGKRSGDSSAVVEGQAAPPGGGGAPAQETGPLAPEGGGVGSPAG